MPEFSYADLLPTGPDDTDYRLISSAGVTVRPALGRDFLEVEPAALTPRGTPGLRLRSPSTRRAGAD